jgi:phage N-6-adenine-methyltransferase
MIASLANKKPAIKPLGEIEMTKASAKTLGYIGAVPGAKQAGRDSDSWYTPSRYIESARKVMGSIDLDPFSSVAANQKVKAKKFLTVDDNALECRWPINSGNVWMNPPYSAKLVKPSIVRLTSEIESGKVRSAVVLVNNATDTQWFQFMLRRCQAICFTAGRIAFENNDGKNISGNTRGQAFLYFGEDIAKFQNEFKQYGTVLFTGAM